MSASNRCRALLAAGALALGGCAGVAGPSPLSRSFPPPWIDGFPADGQLRVGQNVLLSLREVSEEVASIRWLSDTPGVASLSETPQASPCGSACAWLRGESPGHALVTVRVCYVDGGCVTLVRARVCAGTGEPREVETAVSVVG